jgi:hypothetical protein
MLYPRYPLIVLGFMMALVPQAFGSGDFLILLQGESGKSANEFHAILNGPNVETFGTLKLLNLDPESGMQLSCDSTLSECSLTNSGFIQTESYDFDQLMVIRGAPAKKLFDAISSPEKTANRAFLHLGHSGRYGTDVLDCKIGQDGDECQLIRTYCYYPGC